MFEDFQIFLNSFVNFFWISSRINFGFLGDFLCKNSRFRFLPDFFGFLLFFLDFFLEIFVITEIFRTCGKESMLKNNLCVGCVFYFQQWTLGPNISCNI